MKIYVSLLLLIIVSLSNSLSVIAQTPQQPSQDDQVVRVRTTEVALDVVVKDKKGRPVKDLTAGDFEVYEDGVRQRVESFRFVVREAPVTKGNTPERKADKPVPQPVLGGASTPGVIALVFDRLSPEARSLARKAGMAYVQEAMAAGDYTGVFGIDQSLRTLQSFTDNPELIKQAVERATGAATSTYVSGSAKVRENSDRVTGLDQTQTSSIAAAAEAGAAHDGAAASAAGAAAGQAAAQAKLLEMENDILQQYETLERDQQGFATINSLLAVINPMQNLPGRKTLILFSEGLSLPPSVLTKFPAVISAANRANVTIYAIDAAGLRTESSAGEAAREINSIVNGRMRQQGRGVDTASGPYMKALERNEDLLRLDPRSGLGQLADQTGGFLIHDTNDLAAGLRRIDDDMRGYYLVTYIPKNDDYNGRFRHINVKLSRSNLDVQTRKGYYAVESVGNLPVLDYEAPALAAARNARGAADPSSFHAAALSFPAGNRPGLALVLAEAPISAFTFAPSADKKTYNSDFSVVALVKDSAGQVVQKMSQHYPLNGPLDQLDAARKGDLLFYREAQLAPGSYTVELIAYDAMTSKASVRASRLEIAALDESKPRLSSVAVLKRAERLTADEQKKDQPLHFGELVVYPNLGEPLPKSATKQMAFFFTAWPAKGSTAPLQLTMEILQNNRSLGQTSAQLPAADEHGQIKYASALPLDKFQPGNYELKVTVSDGKNRVSSSAPFKIAP
ncbi:MAG TPA: VWA domain-containing protein [Blastocatellia bacterium]|nr:VWA domain-containing protein [Blastocatellia bacterium]